MGRALVDMKKGELMFRLNDDEFTFNIRKPIKQPTNMRVFLVISYVNDPREGLATLMKFE